MGFVTSVLAGSVSAQHGLLPQAKNPSYAPAELMMPCSETLAQPAVWQTNLYADAE